MHQGRPVLRFIEERLLVIALHESVGTKHYIRRG